MVRGRWIGCLEESQSCSFGKFVPSGFQCQDGVEWEGLLGAGTWTGTEPQCVGPGDTHQDRTALRSLRLTWTSLQALGKHFCWVSVLWAPWQVSGPRWPGSPLGAMVGGSEHSREARKGFSSKVTRMSLRFSKSTPTALWSVSAPRPRQLEWFFS